MYRSAHTDIGIRKKVNQDSVIIRQATAGGHEVVLGAVCDGMGGLSNGEIASAEAIDMLDKWFDTSLPPLLIEGLSDTSFSESLNRAILMTDEEIGAFSEQEGDCGTTIAGVLICCGHYGCVNVGDSRVYKIHGMDIEQLTHDQSVVQRLLDSGQITEKEAACHPQRNVLLQCVGAGGDVVPAYTFGTYEEGDVFLICSDGLRHKLPPDEMVELFYPKALTGEEEIRKRVLTAIDRVKERKEKDNISLAVIKTVQDDA